MEEGFLSNILFNGHYEHVAGLDEMNYAMTQTPRLIMVVLLNLNHLVMWMYRLVRVQGTKRQKNFDWKEDEVVCSGWLNVSKDPIHGANQTKSTFWGRVHAFFEKNNKTGSVRTESSIMHRWLTIQHQVNKFHACYEAIERKIKVDALSKT